MGVETKGHRGLSQAGVIHLSGQVPGRQSLCSGLVHLVYLFVHESFREGSAGRFAEFWLSVVWRVCVA
jgi:hypothetical protein